MLLTCVRCIILRDILVKESNLSLHHVLSRTPRVTAKKNSFIVRLRNDDDDDEEREQNKYTHTAESQRKVKKEIVSRSLCTDSTVTKFFVHFYCTE